MRGRVGANRGRREALTLTAVLSIGALVLSVFGVLERGEAAVLYVTGSGSNLSPVWVKRPVSTR